MLPPSATRASATALAIAYDGDPDAGKGRCDRRVRLVHGDPHPQDLRGPIGDGLRDRTGRGFDQPIATAAKRPARDPGDLGVGHPMRERARARNPGQVDVAAEVWV